METLADIKKKVDEAIKKEKSGSIDLSMLDNQIRGKKNALEQAESSLKEINHKIAALEDDFKFKNKVQFDALDKRDKELSAKEAEVQKTLEEARQQKAIAAQEAAYSISKSKEAQTIKDEFNSKFNVIREAAKKLLEIVG